MYRTVRSEDKKNSAPSTQHRTSAPFSTFCMCNLQPAAPSGHNYCRTRLRAPASTLLPFAPRARPRPAPPQTTQTHGHTALSRRTRSVSRTKSCKLSRRTRRYVYVRTNPPRCTAPMHQSCSSIVDVLAATTSTSSSAGGATTDDAPVAVEEPAAGTFSLALTHARLATWLGKSSQFAGVLT